MKTWMSALTQHQQTLWLFRGVISDRAGGERFKHTTRPYKVEDVVKLQGNDDVPVQESSRVEILSLKSMEK